MFIQSVFLYPLISPSLARQYDVYPVGVSSTRFSRRPGFTAAAKTCRPFSPSELAPSPARRRLYCHRGWGEGLLPSQLRVFRTTTWSWSGSTATQHRSKLSFVVGCSLRVSILHPYMPKTVFAAVIKQRIIVSVCLTFALYWLL